MRKIVSFAFVPDKDNTNLLIVLADDGTMWRYWPDGGWLQMDLPPQPTETARGGTAHERT